MLPHTRPACRRQRRRQGIYGPAPQGSDLRDLDRDGLLQPFEAADALRQMESLLEQQPLNLGSIRLLAKTDPAAASLEADEWFEYMRFSAA